MDKMNLTIELDVTNPLFIILNTKKHKTNNEKRSLMKFEFSEKNWNDIFKKIKDYRFTESGLSTLIWQIDKQINGSITDKQIDEINCNMIAEMCKNKNIPYPEILKE